MTKNLTPHDAALEALIPTDQRAEFERVVSVLVARNRFLALIEGQRQTTQMSKQQLAERAGLDPASVRRLLTAETANPTTETSFRLLAALEIRLEAVLPSGEHVIIA